MKYVLSICIPTHKRPTELRECLESVSSQDKFLSKIQVVVFNDNGNDGTREIVNSFNFPNIKYVEIDQKQGLRGAIRRVGTLGEGKYIWYLSDDDLIVDGSIKYILRIIEEHAPNVIMGNCKHFVGNSTNITRDNCSGITKTVVLNKESFLKTVSNNMLCSSYFISVMSNLIIESKVIKKWDHLNDTYSSKLDMYPLYVPILYTRTNLSFCLTSNPICLLREDNDMWGKGSPISRHLQGIEYYTNHIWQIIKINGRISGFGFIKMYIYYSIKLLILRAINFFDTNGKIFAGYITYEKKIWKILKKL